MHIRFVAEPMNFSGVEWSPFLLELSMYQCPCHTQCVVCPKCMRVHNHDHMYAGATSQRKRRSFWAGMPPPTGASSWGELALRLEQSTNEARMHYERAADAARKARADDERLKKQVSEVLEAWAPEASSLAPMASAPASRLRSTFG